MDDTANDDIYLVIRGKESVQLWDKMNSKNTYRRRKGTCYLQSSTEYVFVDICIDTDCQGNDRGRGLDWVIVYCGGE